MHLKKILLVMITTIGLVFPIQGYTETITGAQNKELRSKCKDGRPRKTSEYNEVLSQAKSNALKSWAAGKSVAISTLFSENEQQILTNIQKSFSGTKMIDRLQAASMSISWPLQSVKRKDIW